MSKKIEIGIVGGSIGGLQLAYELQKRGFHFDIYERSPTLVDIGAGLVLKPDFCEYLSK